MDKLDKLEVDHLKVNYIEMVSEDGKYKIVADVNVFGSHIWLERSGDDNYIVLGNAGEGTYISVCSKKHRNVDGFHTLSMSINGEGDGILQLRQTDGKVVSLSVDTLVRALEKCGPLEQ